MGRKNKGNRAKKTPSTQPSESSAQETVIPPRKVHVPPLHLISQQKMAGLDSEARVSFILAEVMAGKILILEEGLSPREETELIAQTMAHINQDSFIGIELQSYGLERPSTFLQRMLNQPPRPRMAVIGPADALQFVSKDEEQIVTKVIGKSE